jgi:hypothetical protein
VGQAFQPIQKEQAQISWGQKASVGTEESPLGRLAPYVLDVGFRYPDRPKEGQWLKWRLPSGRVVISRSQYTAPIETFYWEHFRWIVEQFKGEFD